MVIAEAPEKKKAGRPKKVKAEPLQEKEIKDLSSLSPIKHIVRGIATQMGGMDKGAHQVYEVDTYIGHWLEQGYKIVLAVPTHREDDFLEILYVLVRNDLVMD